MQIKEIKTKVKVYVYRLYTFLFRIGRLSVFEN